MKVALWAEIRWLHEVERLSQRAIVRRLHCSPRTVRKALRLTAPPAPTPGPGQSLLDPYRGQIAALLDKYPELSAGLSGGRLSARRSDASGLGTLWAVSDRTDCAVGFGVRSRALL